MNGVRSLAVCLILAVCLVSGCSRDHRRYAKTLPYLDIRDDAGILDPMVRAALEAEAGRAKGFEAHIAVLTVPNTGRLEPLLFANRAFASFPTYHGAFRQKLDRQQKKRFRQISPAWSPRGILVCVSLQPRLVQVRLGEEIRYAIPQKNLWRLFESRVCPLLMAKQSRQATVAAVRIVLETLEKSDRARKRPNWWWRQIDAATASLASFSYPPWRAYHVLLFRPVLNSLALTLKMSHRQTWGIVAWLLLLVLVPPFLVWHVNSRGAKTGPAVTLIWMVGRIPFFVAIYAVLNLLLYPYWENVVAVKDHLYPAIAHGLDPHDLFALRSGFLWWSDAHAPAGFWMAAVYLLLALPTSLMRLNLQDVDEDQMKGVARAVVLPVASAFVPFVITLFAVLWALGDLMLVLMLFAFRPRGR